MSKENVCFILVSILNILFGMETYCQSQSLNISGGYAYQNGEGTNLTVSYDHQISQSWSWKIQVGLSNTFSRTFQGGGPPRPEIASFMDIRRMREQSELVDIYLDPEFVEAYEGQGLAFIEKSPTTYGNRYFLNFGFNYSYIQKTRWMFSFGFGVGVGVFDNTRVVSGGSVYYSPNSNDVLEDITISQDFWNAFDSQRIVKYLFFNNLLDHKVGFEISNRLCVFQYIGYNYDFIAATGIGGDRLNLGTAGVIHINLGVQFKM
ncbi:MAG: hypothetical protein GVY20_03900 [Bacteroidetes bacterium]|jgi:hypothetical protein|nr:hypothetical protein [Bacteroidota bacterium]